jgi:hypothetical protein
MQAIALATGDEFLVPYNLTIEVGNIRNELVDLNWYWYNKYLPNNIAFDDLFSVIFTSNLGFSGICYTFNIVKFEEIFFIEK